MSGPAPTFCPVFPADFLRQSRVEVRRKTGSSQSAQRYQLAPRLQAEPQLGQAEAGHRVGLSSCQGRRGRQRWAAGEFAVADKLGRGRKAEFSPPGAGAGEGRGLRTGRGQQTAAESPVPGRRYRPRPPSPGHTEQSVHGVADARDRCDQAVARSGLDVSSCSALCRAGWTDAGLVCWPLARPTPCSQGPQPQG